MSSTSQALPKTRSSKGEQARRIGLGALGALVILFALVNLDDVRVNWIVFTSQTPLIVVIAVAFALGGAAGMLLRRQKRAGRSPKAPTRA
jgi:uncharacterized integral membrane protein